MTNDIPKVPELTPERPCIISWPESGKLRARDVVRRSNYRVTGKYPSIKMGRMMQWESRIERNALTILDADPAVTRFGEQPVRIDYALRGETRVHFPDLLIVRGSALVFREVKTDKEAADTEIQERSGFLASELPVLGFAYELWLESDVNRQPRLDNARFLTRLGRGAISQETLEFVRRTLAQSSAGVTMGEVMSGLLGNKGVFIICRAIMDGHVQFCAEERLDDTSTVLKLR